MTALTIWWHRRILRHQQQPVMNGATEAGVWCWCDGVYVNRWYCAHEPRCRSRYRRWFPSDGGRGR